MKVMNVGQAPVIAKAQVAHAQVSKAAAPKAQAPQAPVVSKNKLNVKG